MVQKSSIFPLFVALIMACAVAGIAVAAQAGAVGRPDLSGQWRLNRSLGDDPQAEFGSMGGAGGHHGGGGGPFEEIRNSMLNAPARLVLAQDDQKVVLTEPGRRVRTLPTNNRAVKIDGRDVRARWEKSCLVTETSMENGKLVETYERSPEGRQLIVVVRTEMHGQPVSVRRIYDWVK